MGSDDPLPKPWRYAAVIVAVILAGAVTGRALSFATGVEALMIALAVAFTARLLYSRTRK
jgi:hypothetical protein